jgi:ADP-ribose pyrophosphatase YjhB (NUDIX family)
VVTRHERDEWNRRHTRVASYALCLDEQQRLLLCRIAPGYPAEGMWTLPGGGIDFGEHPADGAVRELAEETGLAGRVESIAFVHSFSREADEALERSPWHGIQIVYRVTVTGGDLRDEVDESTDKAAWLARTEIDRLRVSELVNTTLSFLDSGGVPGVR